MKIKSFFQEVKYEVGKVTWPERKEVMHSVFVVGVVVLVAGLFFMLVDTILFKIVKLLLG